MKIFIGGVYTETNTFAAFATTREDFSEWFAESIGEHTAKVSAESGVQFILSPVLGAMPANKTVRADYEVMRDEMLAALQSAMPVDAVVLTLHGAMIAQGYDDCEGDMIERVRQIVGAEIPLITFLDPHAHLTSAMIDGCDALLFYKEWPHTDFTDCFIQAVELARATAAGRIKPVMSVWDCRMIDMYATQQYPMAALVADMRMLEQEEEGILSVSICHGFPFANVRDLGTKIVVVSDGDKALARKYAQEIGERLFAIRGKTIPTLYTLNAGLDAVLTALEDGKPSPVVIADNGDITGGGAAGDNVAILAGLIDRGVENVAVAYIWDPIAVSVCFKAGTDCEIDLRLGGFSSPVAGCPLDLMGAEVIALIDDHMVDNQRGEGPQSQGRIALIHAKGNIIAISDQRLMALHHNHFSSMGVDPAKQSVLIVKSANNYFAGFQDISSVHIPITYSGPTDASIGIDRLNKVRRPLWPYDDIEASSMSFFESVKDK